MDGQSKCIHEDLAKLKIHLKLCSNNDHVGYIEHLNITMKETACGIYNTIQFKKVPGRMIVELIDLVVFWVNSPTPSPYITGDLSTWYIITGMMVYCVKHCQL